MTPENHSIKRSIAKSITWRIIGILLLGGLAWIFTGDVGESIAISAVFNGIRLFLFVFHEEAWERWPRLARFGRLPRVHTSTARPHEPALPSAAPAATTGWAR